MKARNHHHMPQPYAVEVVPVGLLQAGLIPCEKGMEKPSLPGGYSWSSMARISPVRMVRAYRTELLSPGHHYLAISLHPKQNALGGVVQALLSPSSSAGVQRATQDIRSPGRRSARSAGP